MTIQLVRTGATKAIEDVPTSRLAPVASSRATSRNKTRASPRDINGPDVTSVSGKAALLDKLKSLEKSEPTKFKAVMSTISDTLKSDAKASTDPKEQKKLAEFATSFDAASQTGDIATLAAKVLFREREDYEILHGVQQGPPSSGTRAYTQAASSYVDEKLMAAMTRIIVGAAV